MSTKRSSPSSQLNEKFSKKMKYSTRENIITCPITHLIFFDPVIAKDGHTYERTAIEAWFKVNTTSPITNEDINTDLICNFTMKSLVSEYLFTNPELKKEQFDSPPRGSELLNNALDYDSFDWKYIFELNQGHKNILFQNEEIMKHIIDHSVDLEARDKHKCRPIHYICYYSTPTIIKYIINKKVDIEAEDEHNCKPIHYVCCFSTPEILEYMINLVNPITGVPIDLEAEDAEGNRPIHLICRFSTPKMIKLIIDKGVDLEEGNNNYERPIHLICFYSTLKMIKYIINKGVDLEVKNSIGYRPIHILCNRGDSKMIKYIIDKGVDLNAKSNNGNIPFTLICQYASPKMRTYIMSKNIDIPIGSVTAYLPIEMIKKLLNTNQNISCDVPYIPECLFKR